MHIAKLKQLIALLLMLALAGQAVASASMACLGASSAASHQQTMAADAVAMNMAMTAGAMDHSQHQANASDSSQLGCCPSCDCSLGGCSTVITFVTSPLLASKLHASVPPHRNTMAFNTLANSLYRPPIRY
ncbi:hypothetical protein [Dasania marina]|uniref:hypothetical protein n=1 Tax=Dasania marina TaxID=471499 RepID=UPI0030D980A4|tara:strand:+ start:6841 stop:7233 length:393 start_codon:yes stop_codon:yes gene_type:complete